MKKLLLALLLPLPLVSHAQPLRDINYEYLYQTEGLRFGIARGDSSYTILYSLHVKDTANFFSEYYIRWEGREMLSDKEGSRLMLEVVSNKRVSSGLEGRATLPLAGAPKYLVARVIKTSVKTAWLFYAKLDPDYPVNNYLLRSGSIAAESYIHTNEPVRIGEGSDEWIISYYNDDFPAAAPAYSEAQARVPAKISADSVFRVRAGDEVSFPRKGLYLAQKDTTSLQGFAFRAEDDYPQYTKLASLSGPLIYITTRQENERLEAARGNKKAFDRVILTVTSDTERARTLMRSYFRRVEMANRLFTSYKEGWKTDRGMIYIIFGKPDQVFKFDDREVWNYSGDFKVEFTFTRSASLFDPDNFVLIRDKKKEDVWYEVIDLWRNARF
ncbi:MAG TPA: GWxTD domain-containing protein [Chryseosolibacter sp.]